MVLEQILIFQLQDKYDEDESCGICRN